MEMDLRKIARFYYKRKDIQKAIADHSANREVVPRYLDSFGKRPDIISYPADVAGLAEKGATSFHFSEERWFNPLDLGTSMTAEKMNELRMGWDLILDVDSKFIDFSKITAELILGALKFHNIQNVGLKFSGRGGWHILVPFEAFPKEVRGIGIKDLFPQGPRMVSAYLRELIEASARERILDITSPQELAERIGKPLADFYEKDRFNPFSVVDIDTIAISPRHLIRMPYSLNEKSGLASIVIQPDQIKSFHLGWAKPDRVYPKPFFPAAEKDEAKELMLQALDWQKMKEKAPKRSSSMNLQSLGQGNSPSSGQQRRSDIVIKDASPDLYPPCIMNAMKGMKTDGKKRCLFVILNYFRSINLSNEELIKKINEWNEKNGQQLKEGYITGQLSWHMKNRIMLPPNCEKIQTMYKDLGICAPDPFCQRIKNPVNYTFLKYRDKTSPRGDFKDKKKKRKSSTSSKEDSGGTRIFRGRV